MELEEATRDLASSSGSDGGGSGSSAGDPDLLSALPDCVLHSILSLLKARQAVQTCMLSKRWRHLWRSVPCLDVDFNEFKTLPPFPLGLEWYSDSDHDSSGSDRDGPNSDINERKYKEWREQWEGFEDFAENLVHHFNIALLDSFRLNVSSSFGEPMFCDKFAGGWFRRAMKYCAPDPSSQREGLSSNSWRLRRLYLYNVALDNRFTEHVSSVCHSLEDLELEDCTCQIHSITSHSLKNLILKNCIWRRLSKITSPTLKSLVIAGGSNGDDCVLVITAPIIAHLCLDVPPYFARPISVNQMPSLPRQMTDVKNRRVLRASPKVVLEQSKKYAKGALEHYNKKEELVDIMPVNSMREACNYYTHVNFTARSSKEGSEDQLFSLSFGSVAEGRLQIASL